MNGLRAITREVSRSLAECELTHVAREPIDVARARAQHDAYEAALRAAGVTVERLPELPEHPDAVFVEDTALVLDEVAVVLRPGAASRRGETASVAAALAKHREVVGLDGGGEATVDGGDLLRIGRTIHVGLSTRSGEAGARALAQAVAPWGYRVRTVPIVGCLHLKSAASLVAEGLVLVRPEWVDPRDLEGAPDVLAVDAAEAHAANVLRLPDRVFVGAAFPRTAALLARRGLRVELVDLSELAKAEGALTCCSLIFAAGDRPGTPRRIAS